MLIETFLSPTIWLVKRAIRDHFSNVSASTSNSYQETLKQAAEAQDILVATLGWVINVLVFGQLVDNLLVVISKLARHVLVRLHVDVDALAPAAVSVQGLAQR